MQNHNDITYQIHESDVDSLLKTLKRWNLDVTHGSDTMTFSVQSNNIVYDITLLITEQHSTEEQLFMLNKYKFVASFEDIQRNLFGRLIWNWK